ncbi:MAG: GNAT family N-acetyltransferase [Anaerolineae bacterium]|nr:GNAT family N-acetyltransferase [Anaerolineae bacterium]
MTFSIETIHSVAQYDPVLWDQLGRHEPFTSHKWYLFAETVLQKDTPLYIIVSKDQQPVGRAAFWVKREEALPVTSLVGKLGINLLFKLWPLMICQSPMANAGGLILPDSDQRTVVFDLIMEEAAKQMGEYKASFLVLDFMTRSDAEHLRFEGNLVPVELPEQGTYLNILWNNFEGFISNLSAKERKNYRQNRNKAAKLGVQIRVMERSPAIEETMALIAAHDKSYRTPVNPWTENMLEYSHLVNSVWIGAYVGEKLVGCGLLLEDNGSWVATAMGRDYDYPYVYFVIGYESIKYVIENGGGILRWGTGAYQYKKRLGFQLEDTNFVSFMAGNKLVHTLLEKFAGQLVKI